MSFATPKNSGPLTWQRRFFNQKYSDRRVIDPTADWSGYRAVFASPDGVFWAVDKYGDLHRYTHLDRLIGGGTMVPNSQAAGRGWSFWTQLKGGNVDAGCNGQIFALHPERGLAYWQWLEYGRAWKWNAPTEYKTSDISGKTYNWTDFDLFAVGGGHSLYIYARSKRTPGSAPRDGDSEQKTGYLHVFRLLSRKERKLKFQLVAVDKTIDENTGDYIWMGYKSISASGWSATSPDGVDNLYCRSSRSPKIYGWQFNSETKTLSRPGGSLIRKDQLILPDEQESPSVSVSQAWAGDVLLAASTQGDGADLSDKDSLLYYIPKMAVGVRQQQAKKPSQEPPRTYSPTLLDPKTWFRDFPLTPQLILSPAHSLLNLFGGADVSTVKPAILLGNVIDQVKLWPGYLDRATCYEEFGKAVAAEFGSAVGGSTPLHPTLPLWLATTGSGIPKHSPLETIKPLIAFANQNLSALFCAFGANTYGDENIDQLIRSFAIGISMGGSAGGAATVNTSISIDREGLKEWLDGDGPEPKFVITTSAGLGVDTGVGVAGAVSFTLSGDNYNSPGTGLAAGFGVSAGPVTLGCSVGGPITLDGATVADWQTIIDSPWNPGTWTELIKGVAKEASWTITSLTVAVGVGVGPDPAIPLGLSAGIETSEVRYHSD